MSRNKNATQVHIIIILILNCLSANNLVTCYQIQLPNYQILRSQRILSENSEFLHEDTSSLKQMNGQFNEAKKLFLMGGKEQPLLVFQMFVYPYRVYSFFDQTNKKQYLFKKVDFQMFRMVSDQYKQKQNLDLKSIIEVQFDIKDCLFQHAQNHSQNPSEETTQSHKDRQCLNQSQLYSLLPDLLAIVQEEHESLELEKVNEDHFLIKNHANQGSKHEIKYYLNLDLFKVNIHSFIYQARYTLMKYLFEQKNKNNSNHQNQTSQSEQQAKPSNANDGQFNEPQNVQLASSQYKIKLRDYFQNERAIWKVLYEKDIAIFTNLFNFETSYNFNKNTKFDYLEFKSTFYLAEVNHYECPLSTDDLKFNLFSSQNDLSHQSEKQRKICTYLMIHRVPFVQFQIPQPVQYISEQSFFNDVQTVSLGLIESGSQNDQSREKDLIIHIKTQEMNVQILYGRSWKQIRAEERPKNLKKNEEGLYPLTKTFFLENSKVQIKNDSFILYTVLHNNSISRFTVECQLKIQPFILSVQKVNDQTFVVCAEGSFCKIINKKCETVQSITLQNALGMEWSYKLNYMPYGQVLSYIYLSRRSDYFYQALHVPIDQTELQFPFLRTGDFFEKFQFVELQPGLYDVGFRFIRSAISYRQGTSYFEVEPLFTQNIEAYNYLPSRIFQDRIYQSFTKFKQTYLDQILMQKLIEKFSKFYFPNLTKTTENRSATLLNMRNYTQFQSFFSDCKIDTENNLVNFEQNWKGCKIVLKTSSLMLAQPFQIKKQIFRNQSDQVTNVSSNETLSKGSYKTSYSQNLEKETEIVNGQKQLYEIFSHSGNNKNLVIVCSAHKNSPAYAKCKVTAFQITDSFHDWKRKSKFFLEGGKYFQLYFFNQKFLTQSDEKSFLQLLQRLARESFSAEDSGPIYSSTKAKESQLKSYKILYQKSKERPKYDIALVDYEKQQIQNISKILLITLCILFPALTICCCVVCFKSHFQNILIYYGVMNAQPSFRYPLSNLALKIKMKELSQNGYVKVHKNKRVHKKEDELSSDLEIKYSAECCFCLEELELNVEVAELYCRHEFHSNCFIEWVKNQPNTKCPLCKRAFTKIALNQFNTRSSNNSTLSPSRSSSRSSQQFSEQNESDRLDQDPNQIEMIEFQS